jgi:hypothetical protein
LASIQTLRPVDLIQQATPEPVISHVAFVGDIALLHGFEESFKSIAIIQLAESLALGIPFLRLWDVSKVGIIGVVETEMHEAQIGQRFRVMFPSGPPNDMRFLGAQGIKQFRRTRQLEKKLDFIQQWVDQEHIDVLIVDTVNDFFRGDDDPNSERDAGNFFDLLRNMNQLKLKVLVRHDRKHKTDSSGYAPPSSNELIRGSAEWKEDPELIFYLQREDKRTNKLRFEVGKFRYGQKPEPVTLWFDAGTFRLTPLPPVAAILEDGPKTREGLVADGARRFNLSERSVDKALKDLKDQRYLVERQQGHQKVFSIDWERAREAPEWGHLLIGGEIYKVA